MRSMQLLGRGIVALALGIVVAVGVVLLRPGGSGLAGTPPPSAASAGPTARASQTPRPSASRPSLSPSETPGASPSGPTLEQMIGQKLIIRMDGLTPSPDLLGRIGRGEVGGVILFGANISTPAALASLTGELQDAAAAGGQPRLIIAVDQEGGSIRRVPWAPPTLSAPEMGEGGDSTVAQDQGTATGDALRQLGINVDLAPVADVPGSSASFMYKDKRTFSFDSAVTAQLADAFATGLESAGVMPAMKHFPGLGLATKDTDTSVVTITASTDELDPGLAPYRTAIGDGIPLIMLSNATYSAYDPDNAAGWSEAISNSLLRDELGFTGVTITDSLTGTAKARGLSPGALAVRAARAGTDLILVSGSEAATRATYATLVRSATDGSISLETLASSYDRILALKAGL